MARDQAREIYEYIRANPMSDAETIAKGTGWNRYVVDMALSVLEEQRLIRKAGKTEWGDDAWDLGKRALRSN